MFIVTFLLLFRQQERIHISEICLLLYIYQTSTCWWN